MARSVLLRWHDACPFNGAAESQSHWTILLQLRPIVSRIGLCASCLSNIARFESSIFLIIRMITDPFKLLLVWAPFPQLSWIRFFPSREREKESFR